MIVRIVRLILLLNQQILLPNEIVTLDVVAGKVDIESVAVRTSAASAITRHLDTNPSVGFDLANQLVVCRDPVIRAK